ncbi:hypothetical protein [Fluviicola taffensis]|uniref:Uncharacterized protein n=1 Tax=Fluviicola taffensis (strain DSM 16823 / NCIMB 13979 / RW262) TaxID=755732 RepID=F2IG29_FLUTR|nr:hypothetical protein [Fluviicola taffensis]AEA44664.1 hypothetical protein Fluta_2683 [Fluviicola taffensis DSM 16823]
MKHLIPSIILLLCFGCSDHKTTSNNQTPDSVFGSKLIAADFLIYADSLTINEQTEQVKNSFDIYDERNYKILHIDAEELAEFNFDFFQPQLNEILGKRNFHLDVKATNNYETSHEVFLNGEKLKLFTNEELEKGDFLAKASRTFFKKLNEFLKKQHFKESFFLLYSDNDLQALLLTDKQFQIIAERYENEPIEIPYRP